MTAASRGVSRAIGAALAVLGLIAIAWLFLASPLFRISSIPVEGNARLTDEDVRTLGGARVGSNLIFLSERDIEEALEASPWISDAVVEQRLPDTLVLRVTERRPVAWARDRAAAYLVAADGVVVAELDGRPALPSLGRYPELQPGERLPGPLDAVRVVASLSDAVRRQIDVAELAPDGVLLRMAEGSFVTYGPASEIRRKTAALEGILEWAEEERIEFRYVDVRVPESPVLRPVGPSGREVRPDLQQP